MVLDSYIQPHWHFIVGASTTLLLNVFVLFFTNKRALLSTLLLDLIIIPIILTGVVYFALGFIGGLII